jgi:hypothetical protein
MVVLYECHKKIFIIIEKTITRRYKMPTLELEVDYIVYSFDEGKKLPKWEKLIIDTEAKTRSGMEEAAHRALVERYIGEGWAGPEGEEPTVEINDMKVLRM